MPQQCPERKAKISNKEWTHKLRLLQVYKLSKNNLSNATAGALPPPVDNYRPRDGFQGDGDDAEADDHAGVSSLPFLLRVEYVETLVDVGDAKDDHSVAHRVVVYIPVDAVLVIFFRSKQQGKYLHFYINHFYYL